LAVLLQPILVGARRRSARAWLIFCDESLRGILSRGADGEVVLTVACDRRIQSDELMRFADLAEAQAWISRRLTRRAAHGSSGMAETTLYERDA
jgi:hypothetical protein